MNLERSSEIPLREMEGNKKYKHVGKLNEY